jgi:hypothetical protein
MKMNFYFLIIIIIIILNQLSSIKSNKTEIIKDLKIDIHNFDDHQQFPSIFKCLFNNFTILFVMDNTNNNDDDDGTITINNYSYKTYSSLYIKNSNLNDNSTTNYKSVATLYPNLRDEASNFRIITTLFEYYNDILIEISNIKPHYSSFGNIHSESVYLIDNHKIAEKQK